MFRSRNRAMAAIILTAAGVVVGLTSQPATAGPAAPAAGVFNPIRNVGNNLCLQPEFLVAGSRVLQEPCINSSAQGWEHQRISGTRYRFVNQGSGLCLRAFTSAANGSPIGVAACRAESGQEFETHAVLPNVVTLESRIGFRNTGFCIDVPGSSTTPGVQMQLFQCNGTLAQRWVVGFALV